MDPTTLVVYEMNGEPLPERHGYPARVIVPGLFGKNHVKWITRIELANTDVQGFYEQQGWGPSFVVPTTSRFDEPAQGQTLHVSEGTAVLLKGIAYAGARGVNGVEVSVDNAQTWQRAQLDYKGAPMAWVLWSYEWRPRRTRSLCPGRARHRWHRHIANGHGPQLCTRGRDRLSLYYGACRRLSAVRQHFTPSRTLSH